MNGWAGQRLKVYLTEGKIVKEPLSEDARLNYLGGRGLNSKTLLDDLKPGVDPLGPDNVFAVGTGPLNGTAAMGTARWTVSAKSTVFDGVGDGNGGGDFATELKYAGYDQVVVYGRSPKPVYLWINDGHVELRDASFLWGKTTSETNRLLWKELRDREVRVLTIGPAGENLVRGTNVFTNMTRSGGRGGMGAVMGSKNLKAIAVRGSGSIKVARPQELLRTLKGNYARLMASPTLQKFMEQGTLGFIDMRIQTHNLPTRNSQAFHFEGAEKMTYGAYMKAGYDVSHRACSSCPLACSHYYQVKDGPYACRGESPEYGTIHPLGNRCGNDNLAAALFMSGMCDELGLETMTIGHTIAFAMHCWQEGLITAKDTDGLDLSWGNVDSMIKLLHKIAYREGFGNLLAECSARVSKQIPGSARLLQTVKGLETANDFIGPGLNIGAPLAHATSTSGGTHRKGSLALAQREMPGISEYLTQRLGDEEAHKLLNSDPFSTEGKGGILAVDQDFVALHNSLEMCARLTDDKAGGIGLADMVQIVACVTGVEMSAADLMKIGERIYNVEKAINVREGMRRKDDTLPPRWFVVEETPWGVRGINEAVFQTMLDDYYQFRGWDREGIPSKRKLEELGLGSVAAQVGAK